MWPSGAVGTSVLGAQAGVVSGGSCRSVERGIRHAKASSATLNELRQAVSSQPRVTKWSNKEKH